MIVMADTLRRCVVAQSTGNKMESNMLLQVEQMAAIATAVGAQRLQKGGKQQAEKFCELFGLKKKKEEKKVY